MKFRFFCFAVAAVSALALSSAALASPINIGPPVGAILDLNGQALPGGGNGTTLTGYAAFFTATASTTTITLAFRDDGAFIDLYDAVVAQCADVACTSAGSNLLLNSQFDPTTVHSQNGNSAVPADWNYDNIYGASFGGQDTVCDIPGTSTLIGDCWHDGATQAYDAISQDIATVSGDTYVLELFLAEDDNTILAFNGAGFGYTNFSALSTNDDNTADGGHDGNAIDALAYALPGDNDLPVLTPEPAPWLLLATGLLGLGAFWRRRQTAENLSR